MNTNVIIDGILRREGGFVDHEADQGGATKYGVTQATLTAWRGRPVSVDDVRGLTEHEAREIYREEYIVRPGLLSIENEQVRSLVVDSAVNHGVKNAVKLLQQAAHVFPDGIFGPNTQAAVNRMTAAVLYRRLCAERVRFYGAIVTNDPELVRAKLAGYDLQAEFSKGWAKRIAEFIEESP